MYEQVEGNGLVGDGGGVTSEAPSRTEPMAGLWARVEVLGRGRGASLPGKQDLVNSVCLT